MDDIARGEAGDRADLFNDAARRRGDIGPVLVEKDLVKLYEKGIGKAARQNLDLLASVAKHKSVFFRSAGAKYEEAIPGSLRLLSPVARKTELEIDYAKMREIMFGDPPVFDELLDVLAKIEQTVNKGR